MFTEESLDRFIDAFWENHLSGEEVSVYETDTGDDLEEYGLPLDGMIIRPVIKGKVAVRTWVSLAVMMLTLPFILYLSVRYFHGRKYLLCSLIVVLFAMAPFFMVFEGRKPQAREIMVISVLAAIGVAGRAAFYMLPHFKPIAAVVILTGVSFGGEAGFLVGCMIMMVSNMFMGQGPWTPWQMFSYGIIGFLAGILFQKGVLKPKKLSLCIYGFLSVIFIFGGIMNPASILMSYGTVTWESLLAYYISGLPVDLVQAVSTVIFLLLMSRPLLEKLERIKKKYGLIETEAGRDG
ncbi:MAG TPA: ECF transporter S component [Lachnospiraceae bacterium]|nr:ECF transporter S component [Lachnospiraceae bacterium]